MDFEDLKNEAWVATGCDTQLNPATDVSWGGYPRLNMIVNEGQRQVAKWKNKETGRPNRINDLMSSFHYSTYYEEDTIASVQNDTDPYYITLTTAGIEDRQYEGWVCEVTSGDADGEILYAYSYVGTSRTMYFNKAFGTAPTAGDTVKLYKRFELLLPSTHAWSSQHISLPIVSDVSLDSGNFFELLSIVDVTNGKELDVTTKTEKFPANTTQVGTPSYWYQYGNALYYDVNVADKIKYRVEYYRMPMDMSIDTDEPDIPKVWHTAIVLWSKWYILQRKMESGLAYAAKMDFEDEMRRTVNEFEVRKERTELRGAVMYEEE